MWLLLLMLLVARTDQYVRDTSFINFCNNLGGQLTMQTIGSGIQTEGDKCIITYDFPAADQEEAKEYCHQWNMYPISNTDMENNKPVCTYENVYECLTDYKLIGGHCYKMVKSELVSYEDATKACADQSPRVNQRTPTLKVEMLRFFDPDLIRMFRAYFTDKSLIFIQPDLHMFDSVDFKGDGENYAIAFGMASVFKVGSGAVVKLPAKTRAQAMCFYRAEETTLSFSYKARKLAPYYHPMNTDGGGLTMWRTTGHYGAKNENDKDAASKNCEKSMRAIVGPDNGDAWDATNVNVQKLSDKMKKSVVMSFAPYAYCCYQTSTGYSRLDGSCPSDWYHYIVFRSHYTQFDTCRAYKYIKNDEYPSRVPSASDVPLPITYLFYPELVNGEQIGQRTRTAMDAPVFCNLRIQDRRRPKNCEPGWTKYHRENDIVVCHKYFGYNYNFDDALSFCKQKGGTLPTFTNEEEYYVFAHMIDKFQRTPGVHPRVWLGLRKRLDCPEAKPGKCTRENLIIFADPLFGEDTVAVRKETARRWTGEQPGNTDNNEYCIGTYEWADQKTLMNDWGCHCVRDMKVACMKAATLD